MTCRTCEGIRRTLDATCGDLPVVSPGENASAVEAWQRATEWSTQRGVTIAALDEHETYAADPANHFYGEFRHAPHVLVVRTSFIGTPSCIWETMTFTHPRRGKGHVETSLSAYCVARYVTRQAALNGHRRICAEVRYQQRARAVQGASAAPCRGPRARILDRFYIAAGLPAQ